MSTPSSRVLVVMTRFPQAGRAKTRLIPALGPEGAADLQRRLTRHIMIQARRAAHSAPARLMVSYGDGTREQMAAWLGDDVAYQPQSEGDIGWRMAQSMAQAFGQGAAQVVVAGSDVPQLNRARLTRAFELLENHDLVLGPSTDGGYYLIALKQPAPGLFEDIAWSTDKVLAQTQAAAKQLGMRVGLLDFLGDIDRPRDLDLWRAVQQEEAEGISVIIPALNEEAVIGRTVRRVLAGGAAEAIVVDGRSQDRTVVEAQQAGALVVKGSRGRAAQMNLGASLAMGPHLLFLHADTQAPSSFASEVRRILANSGVACGAFRFQLDHRPAGLRFIELAVDLRCALASMPYGDQGLFVLRDTFDRAGGFPELPIMEDVEMVKRLRQFGCLKMSPLPAITSARRWRAAGVWKTTGLNYLMMIAHHLGADSSLLRRIYDRADSKRNSSNKS